MDLRLLGPVEASVDDHPVAIGAGKPRALLAMLALNEGTAVSAESLIDGLWGEAPPATAPKMVQIYVSQLRKAFKGQRQRRARSSPAGTATSCGSAPARSTRAASSGSSPMGRRARRSRCGADRRSTTSPPSRSRASRSAAWRSCASIAIEQALEQDLAAGRHAEVIPRDPGAARARAAARAPARPAHARALPQRPPGRRARRLPPGARRARQRDRRRARPRAAPPARGDPAAGPVARPAAAGRAAARARGGHAARRPRRRARRAARALAPRQGRRRRRGRCSPASAASARPASPPSSPPRCTATAATSSTRPGPARRRRRARSSSARGPRGARRCWCWMTPGSSSASRVADRPLLVLATAHRRRRRHADARPARRRRGRDDRARVRRRACRSSAWWRRAAASRGACTLRLAGGRATTPTRRLGATADRAAGERARLRAAEDDLAAGVVELQAARERVEPAWDPVTCPFKGLASFDVDDADVFFGRERLVAEMVARLAGAPLLGIVGPSGSGKSSALQGRPAAGARSTACSPAATAGRSRCCAPARTRSRRSSGRSRTAAPDGRLVIAVDQFEELFTACRDEAERAAFADALVAAVRDPRRRALVLIALRADFYGRCASYPELWRMLGANHVPVGPMRRDELRRAIELARPARGPARRRRARRRAGRRRPGRAGCAAAALDRAARAVAGARRPAADARRPTTTRAACAAAVARLAERVYDELDAGAAGRARAILVRLAGVGEGEAAVRRRVPLAELERTPGDARCSPRSPTGGS